MNWFQSKIRGTTGAFSVAFLGLSYLLYFAYFSYFSTSAAFSHNHINEEATTFHPRDKWAVLVGVGSPNDNNFGTMLGASQNVDLLEQSLRNASTEKFAADHVLTLTEENATKSAIEDAITLKWLSHKALPNDLLVLYFCGRILPSEDHSDAVFCAYDIDAAHPNSSGVELKRLLDDLRIRTQCKEIICFLDTSPSILPAASQDLASTDLARVEHFAQDCHISVLSANQLFQVSHADNVTGNSIFCHYLSDGIGYGAGQWSLKAVADFVITSITRDAEKVHKSQLPIFAVPADEQMLPELTLGCKTKVGSIKPVEFGYSMEERPDLFLPPPLEHGKANSNSSSSANTDSTPSATSGSNPNRPEKTGPE